MATGGAKKSTAPAAKPAAAPKIPAVIAKPTAPAPATKSSGAAPKGGGKAASGTKLVPSTPSGKSSSKSSNQAAIVKKIQPKLVVKMQVLPMLRCKMRKPDKMHLLY